MEEWKTILEKYEISNMGNFRKKRSNYAIERYSGESYISIFQEINTNGYKRVKIRIDKKIKNIYIHKLVALAFIGERPQNMVIDHKNRIRTDNNVENLRYVTRQENNINSSRYRTDIDETDPLLRYKIIQKKRYEKS